MTKLDLITMSTISGGGYAGGPTAQASHGGVAIVGNGNTVYYGNTSSQSSNSGSSKKS